jgi:hypothetical protein
MIRKNPTTLAATAFVGAIAMAGIALAANAHFVTGPTITTTNTSVTACGKIAGLGNAQTVTVLLEASVTTTCTNKGNNIPSGLTQEVSGEGDFSADKNGTVTFCVTTERPDNPCPDGMRPNNTFSDISITVFDAQGNQLLP